jgi:hypothetical protein
MSVANDAIYCQLAFSLFSLGLEIKQKKKIEKHVSFFLGLQFIEELFLDYLNKSKKKHKNCLK